jgi:uncharacterized protein (DUF1697 family)
MSRPERWVAFIRAINGSPHNRIRMVELAGLLTEAGCADVSWHIQTGNMLFAASGDREGIADAIEHRLEAWGMRRADVMLRTPAELSELVARPLPEIDPTRFVMAASFLRRPPELVDTAWLTERGCIVAHLDDTVLVMASPKDGLLRGGGNGVIEQRWRVAATSRWWGVVEQVASKAAALGR